MGTMAVLGEGYGIFSNLLIVFRFPGLQAQYLGQNMPMTKGRICVEEIQGQETLMLIYSVICIFPWDNSDRCWQSKIKLGMMPFGAAEIGVCKAWVCLLWISVQVMFVEGGKSNVDKNDSGKRNPKVACVKSHKFQWRVIWNLSSKKITSPGKKLSVGNFGT